MRKSFILAIGILFISITGYTQSKTETEQWLLSKLNKYTLSQFDMLYHYGDPDKGSYGSTRIENYSFRFEDPYLIISFREKRSTSESFGIGAENASEHISNYEYRIPLAYFQDVIVSDSNAKEYKQGVGYISCIKYQIVVTKDGEMQVTSNGSREPYTYLKITLLISSEEEDNLPQRLKKAFLNLKTLYSKPKAKPKGEGEIY